MTLDIQLRIEHEINQSSYKDFNLLYQQGRQ
jgi:hypothetical protein